MVFCHRSKKDMCEQLLRLTIRSQSVFKDTSGASKQPCFKLGWNSSSRKPCVSHLGGEQCHRFSSREKGTWKNKSKKEKEKRKRNRERKWATLRLNQWTCLGIFLVRTLGGVISIIFSLRYASPARQMMNRLHSLKTGKGKRLLTARWMDIWPPSWRPSDVNGRLWHYFRQEVQRWEAKRTYYEILYS